jgi:hypothetical protein
MKLLAFDATGEEWTSVLGTGWGVGKVTGEENFSVAPVLEYKPMFLGWA